MCFLSDRAFSEGSSICYHMNVFNMAFTMSPYDIFLSASGTLVEKGLLTSRPGLSS
jgi:hypothetical protein